MSDSVQPHRRQPTKLPCPWDSPGKNTGVGCHFLLQCMKVKSESEVAQSDLQRPHGLQPTRLLRPWDFPGKSTGVGCHCLLRYAGQEATIRNGHGTTYWFQIGKGVHQGCILLPCLFNFYAEYIMRNAGLEEAQAGIKIAKRNINNLRYADDTSLMAEIEELKSLFHFHQEAL